MSDAEENITLNVEETEDTQKAAEEAEAKRIADEAESAEKAELAEQLAELERLNNITNKLWKDGKKLDTMTHTEKKMKRLDMKKRGRVHQNFMTSLTKTSQRKGMIKSTTSIKPNRPSLTTRQTMVNSGMMFGNRR